MVGFPPSTNRMQQAHADGHSGEDTAASEEDSKAVVIKDRLL